ncbi:arginine-tRNA ligase, partial [Kipferlia bialata]
EHPDWETNLPDIKDLVELYKEAKGRFEADDEFKAVSRNEVVALQGGDETNLRLWKMLCDVSRREFDTIYDTLDVKLNEVGESFYNPMLAPLVDELLESGVATIEETERGEAAVIHPLEGSSINYPLIVRKSDGGMTYDTTDLAAIRYRTEEMKSDHCIYVVDNGQGTHFQLVFMGAKKMGVKAKATHVGFGLVCGPDGKRYRTRDGRTEKLQDLLKNAIEAAKAQLIERGRDKEFNEEELNKVAHAVGIGAVKYADLSSIRTKNYIFSLERMLSMKGNTAVYMLYQYSRIAGISKKAGVDVESLFTEEALSQVKISTPAERALMIVLARFPDMIADAVTQLYPHKICEYVYALAGAFSNFYEACRVVDETGTADVGRLVLCEMTKTVLGQGLDLLGIRLISRM